MNGLTKARMVKALVIRLIVEVAVAVVIAIALDEPDTAATAFFLWIAMQAAKFALWLLDLVAYYAVFRAVERDAIIESVGDAILLHELPPPSSHDRDFRDYLSRVADDVGGLEEARIAAANLLGMTMASSQGLGMIKTLLVFAAQDEGLREARR